MSAQQVDQLKQSLGHTIEPGVKCRTAEWKGDQQSSKGASGVPEER